MTTGQLYVALCLAATAVAMTVDMVWRHTRRYRTRRFDRDLGVWQPVLRPQPRHCRIVHTEKRAG